MALNCVTSAGISFYAADHVPRSSATLLLHGIGSNGAAFEPFIRKHKSPEAFFAWDMPGYGSSAPLPQPWPVAHDYAAAAVEAVRAMGLERLSIVGHSLGCLVAGAMAAHWPELIARVVFVSPALGLRTQVGDALPPQARSRIDDFERLGPTGLAKARAPLLLAPASRTADLLPHIESGLAALRMPGYAQATRMLASGDLIADAARVHAPALVVTGSEDAITPGKGGDLLAAALNARAGVPSARHILLPAAGHMPFDETPALLATVLADFLRS